MFSITIRASRNVVRRFTIANKQPLLCVSATNFLDRNSRQTQGDGFLLEKMKEIKLSNSELVTLVDDEDYDELSKYKWQARPGGSGVPYVGRSQKINGKGTSVSMHRKLMGNPVGMDVHHINHNTLDNRRENLEVCTHRENLSMRRVRKNKSGIPGVYPSEGKWRMFLGRGFDNPIDAARAYEIAKKALDEVYPPFNKVER
jgi:hypothetical protein